MKFQVSSFKFQVSVLLLSIIFLFLPLVMPVGAQEFSDPLARKLNDFLPTYTPFTPPEPPDRYFPDAVGKQVADAIVDAYLGNTEAVEQHAHALSQQDATLVAQGERATGVTAPVLSLANRSSDDTEQNDTSASALTPNELLTQADQLLTEEKRGRLGRKLNWVLSTFDVASLLLGTPRSPSPYGAQGVVSDWGGKNDPSPRERKALVLYREFLNQVPEDPRALEVEKKAQALETRRKNAMLEAELAQAETAFKKQDYWGANFHYQLALMIDETSTKARAGMEKVEAGLQKHDDLSEAQPQDPLAGVKQAEWEHDKQTLKYLLPGSGFVKDNFVVAGVQVATEGLVGAATFGALTFIQTGAKLFNLLMGNPISQRPVIAEAEKYIHETPSAERSPEVYDVLAKAYEKEGQLDKAITYYKLAKKEERVPRLQERAGEALLQLASQSTHQAQKEVYLRTLVAQYPKTEAARKALPQLRELSLPENRGLHLSKEFLQEHLDLAGPQGLGLKRELFDGDPDNVELTDDGITLLPHGEIALRLQSDQGPRSKIYGVPDATWERFWRRFREKGYEQAALRGDRGLALLAQGAEVADITLKSKREQNEQSGWRVLPQLSGSVGGSGVDFRGTLPKEFIGTRLAFGSDQRSAYVGMELPLPFVPVDFLLLGRNGAPSLYPRIRLPEQELKDEELYR
jgi:tetratricopeptide (TPR) repeat protein